MIRLRMLVTFVVLAILSGSALAQIPIPDWALAQNTPEPFCIDEGGGGTTIQFTVSAAVHVTIEVWDEGMTSVVRTLIDGMRPAGLYMLVWDGRNSSGVLVPTGTYPYTMTATDEGGTEVLFQDTKVAHVRCDTPVSDEAWSIIKALYR